MSDELLTVAEVAELLKLNPQTIYNKISDGSLPSTKVGRGRRIRRADVERLTGSNDSDEIDLLTIAEVAEGLKMNEQTIRNWIDAGTLKALRIGRRVRISRGELDAVLEAGASGRLPELIRQQRTSGSATGQSGKHKRWSPKTVPARVPRGANSVSSSAVTTTESPGSGWDITPLDALQLI